MIDAAVCVPHRCCNVNDGGVDFPSGCLVVVLQLLSVICTVNPNVNQVTLTRNLLHNGLVCFLLGKTGVGQANTKNAIASHHIKHNETSVIEHEVHTAKL